jgi:formate hydrogenlyase subunit 6/NADH:ubiquinone oxidoreductase subunit I
MTISVDDYFKTRKADRKKETRYLAVINKDNCTSCNACATQCPVDCIYEVVNPIPSESFHQIDTSRCSSLDWHPLVSVETSCVSPSIPC